MEAALQLAIMAEVERVRTGVTGLDDILTGGLPTSRMYLVNGHPGVGKTTLALQFLLEGVRNGERVLYVTLSETIDEVTQVAASHGWSLDGITIHELASDIGVRVDANTIYATEDIELRETMDAIFAKFTALAPSRVVIDSLSEIRLLSQSNALYRHQILSFKRFFAEKACTVLLLDDQSTAQEGTRVESLAHGVIALEQLAKEYGADRRRLRVVKLRGSTFRSGYHDYTLQRGGLTVFPRLIAAEHRSDGMAAPLTSGIPKLDEVLGGGIDRATATLIAGAAGTGKSAISVAFAAGAAMRGEHVSVYLFEERANTLRKRATDLGIDLREAEESGHVRIRQIDPAELAPDEFAYLVRADIEERKTSLVVIDSLNGYFTAMPEERFMTLHMHELLAFLNERGVATILTMTQAGIVGAMSSPIDVSFLSDTVVLLRYFESAGKMRKAISVLKKRSGFHETSIREVSLGANGVTVGEALSNFQGVFTGVPTILNGGER